MMYTGPASHMYFIHYVLQTNNLHWSDLHQHHITKVHLMVKVNSAYTNKITAYTTASPKLFESQQAMHGPRHFITFCLEKTYLKMFTKLVSCLPMTD